MTDLTNTPALEEDLVAEIERWMLRLHVEPDKWKVDQAISYIRPQLAKLLAEARLDDKEALIDRLYVALQEQHTINMRLYGANFCSPPTREDAAAQLAQDKEGNNKHE